MKKKTFTAIRVIILAIILIYITFTAYMHQVKGGGPEGSPSIHALCPYGGIESLYTLFSEGTLVDKIYAGTFILFILTLVLAVVTRRSFCGWICPFGALQELLGRLGKKIFKKQPEVPPKLDRILRYLKYPVLILTAVMAWRTASLWMSPYDPWAAYAHIGEGLGALWAEFAVGFILLIVTVVGSLVYNRFFCKYLCPMGAFLAIVSKISPFRIKRVPHVCIDCGQCTKACVMNIDVEHAEVVKSPECINCQECVKACPKEGALLAGFRTRKGISAYPLVTGILALVIFFGGIGIARLAGQYRLLPLPVSEQTVITDFEELKGYMTIREVSDLTGIPQEELRDTMGIPPEIPEDIPMKEIGDSVPGFDFHEAKDKLEE